MIPLPRPGDVLRVDRRASVQFAEDRALIFRVISVRAEQTYDGWCWLAGYVLDPTSGQASDRREIFVQRAGLRPARAQPTPAHTLRPRSTVPHRGQPARRSG